MENTIQNNQVSNNEIFQQVRFIELSAQSLGNEIFEITNEKSNEAYVTYYEKALLLKNLAEKLGELLQNKIEQTSKIAVFGGEKTISTLLI